MRNDPIAMQLDSAFHKLWELKTEIRKLKKEVRDLKNDMKQHGECRKREPEEEEEKGPQIKEEQE